MSFQDLRIVDNFYQTSSFFPMPTVCISTVNDDGSLNIDKILMQDEYYNAIINGVTKDSFPPVPVDYGYRDSTNFWYTPFPKWKKPVSEPIPAPKETDIAAIRYAANRCDDTVKFTDAALQNFVKVPRPFLKTVLNGCVAWAKENGVTLIDDEHVRIINDKRRQEKENREK